MKKEYLVLVMIIAALGAYLAMHSKDRSHYVLPVLSPVEASDITSITLEGQGNTLAFSRKGEAWVVTDREYPADVSKMDKIIGYIRNLTVTALVSESLDLKRYDLDPEHRIAVVARKGDTIVREFEVGKAASTFRHTFVRLAGHQGIFHASQNFRREMEPDLNGFRNKQVLSFDSGKALRVTVTQGEDRRVFEKKVVTGDSADAPETGTWHLPDGSLQTEPSVDTMVSMLADFSCSGFTVSDSKDSLGGTDPLCTISIDMDGESQVSFVLFPKNADGKHPGLSSGSPYPFLVDSYQGDDVLKTVKGLLGLEAREPGTGAN